MSPIDISRYANDPEKHYASVRMQMRRVLTDDDFNENERIHTEDDRLDCLHTVGPSGALGEAFLISDPKVVYCSQNTRFML